jgi:flagellum-specific peptidoglycan hydrolase FlgJ
MGKTKWYSEADNEQSGFNQQARPTAGAATKSRRTTSGIIPGRPVTRAAEALGMHELIRLVMLRLKRPWLALRFQFNRYTFGKVTPKFALQVIFVGLAAWYLLSDSETMRDIVLPVAQHGAAAAVETTLDVSGGGKTNKWKSKNEAAPVSASELYEEQVRDYVQRFAPIAQKEMNQFGIPASISLAQGLIESRAGTSKLAVSNNNHFGIKCFSRRCKKGHCSNFTDDTHKDFFRKFPSPWESWREHSKLLAGGRYKRLQQYGRDYRKWAYGLESVGYATDRTYAEKLVGMIERYRLNQYDR